MLYEYIYEPDKTEDKLFCATVVNILYKSEKNKDQSAFETIVRLQGYSSKTRNNAKLQFRVNFEDTDLDTIVNDYRILTNTI